MSDDLNFKGCNGLFHGFIRIPLPFSCDTLHAGLGLLAASNVKWTQNIVVLYTLYQVAEYLWLRDTLLKDMAIFRLGYLLGLLLFIQNSRS